LIARRAIQRLRRRWTLDRSSSSSLTRTNSRRAYDALYGSRELLDEYLAPSRLAFYDEVAAACAELRPASTVDLGCGSGHLLRALLDRLPEARALGVDHAASGIDVARELVPEARFIVGDLYRLSPPERFDLVLSTEVLEHLTRPREGVERMLEWCAEGGRVAITVPDGAWDAFEGHVNFWSEDALRDFLAPHGLESITRIDAGRTLFAVLAPRP
jgi:SAM-dependent methyltransferase